MEIKLGVGLHWDEYTSYKELIEYIVEVEDLGYDQIWVTNEKFFHDMNSVATIVAEHTTRVKIGTFVSDPYTVHPALTAMFAATLQEISGGRAIIGIGAGGTGFPVMGIKRIKPAEAIRDAVLIIRGLLAGNTVNYHGKILQCNNGQLNVLPRQTEIPIIVASRGDLVLQVSGEVADGVMIATYANPEGVGIALKKVREGLSKSGRNLDEFEIFSRVDTCISNDPQIAIDAVKPSVGILLWTSYPDRNFVNRVGLKIPDELEDIISRRDYNLMINNAHLVPDEFVEKFCWTGTSENVAKKVAEIARMGINNITFLPHATKESPSIVTVRVFAKEVKPLVEKMLL